MSFKFPRTARLFRGQLDASPFVGVLFLLAIFLLLNSTLVFAPGLAIQLPEAGELPGSTNPVVRVAVDASGRLFFENQTTSSTNLEAQLRLAAQNLTPPPSLLLIADQRVPNEMLVRVLTLARRAGLKDALLATRSGTPAAAPAREGR